MNSTSNEPFEAGMKNLSLDHRPNHPFHPSPNFLGNHYNNQDIIRNEQYQSDSDDEQPLSYKNSSNPSSTFSRPVSVRNMTIETNSSKPANFIKPAATQFNNNVVPSDMRAVQQLYENYGQKVYTNGYLFKKNALMVDGKPHDDTQWSGRYVELCGSVLTLWDTECEQEENVKPEYINIADSKVELLGRIEDRENVFSLNSAGVNQFLFDAQDYSMVVNWVCAIRLSCFECSRIQEIYTRSFINRSAYSDILTKPMQKMEGFVQARFSGTTEWQKYWVVVSDRKEEKKLFGKKSVQAHGQMMFYENKKAKHPIRTMVDIVQAYIVYPESPQLIDSSALFKVEGSMLLIKPNGEQQSIDSCSSAMLMTSSPKELMQWTIGTFDAFKLYGRPTQLIDDPNNINSLNFGEIQGKDLTRLFLEVPEVCHLSFKESLLDSKAQFASILQHKLNQSIQQRNNYSRQPQQPMGPIHQVSGGTPIHSNGQHSPQRIYPSVSSTSSDQPRALLNNNPQQFPQQQSSQQQSQPTLQQPRMMTHNNQSSGRMIYASDDSEEDDEEEDDEEEEEEEDRGFMFNNKSKSNDKPQNITKESLFLPTMSSEDDGFASSILGGIEKHTPTADQQQTVIDTSVNDHNEDLVSSPKSITSSRSLSLEPASEAMEEQASSSNISLPQVTEKHSRNDSSDDADNDSDLSDSEAEAPRVASSTAPSNNRRPRPKVARTQVSISGSDSESDLDEENSFSGSDDEHIQHDNNHAQEELYENGQFDDYSHPQQYWGQDMMDPNMQQHYDEYGNLIEEDDEEGPIIPQLGDPFVTQNSLLDTYRAVRPTAHEQEGHARATGQPLIQVPNRPPEPRAGLVGMISQIEHEKRNKESNKNRILEMERERYMLEQRAQMGATPHMMMMDPQMMMNMQMMNGQMPMMNMMGGQMPMMYPQMMYPQMMQQMPGMMQQAQGGMMQQAQGGMMQQGQGSMMQQGQADMMYMPMMMDPRMSMMQNPGQMWAPAQSMYNGQQGYFNQVPEEDEDDEDDDVPLGAKSSPIPRTTNNK